MPNLFSQINEIQTTMDANTLTLSGLCLVIIVLLVFIAKMLDAALLKKAAQIFPGGENMVTFELLPEQ